MISTVITEDNAQVSFPSHYHATLVVQRRVQVVILLYFKRSMNWTVKGGLFSSLCMKHHGGQVLPSKSDRVDTVVILNG